MGEGAIEGVAAQYEMVSMFATDFSFSRFKKISALPRNVSELAGMKIQRQEQTSTSFLDA